MNSSGLLENVSRFPDQECCLRCSNTTRPNPCPRRCNFLTPLIESLRRPLPFLTVRLVFSDEVINRFSKNEIFGDNVRYDLFRRMTRFVLTGFGSFREVVDNPSSELVVEVAIRYGENSVLCIPDIRVSVSGAADVMQNLLRLIDFSHKTIVIHFGADTSATQLKLEQYAFNEKNFRIPDSDGEVCCGERIRVGGPAVIKTPIDTSDIEPIDSRIESSEDPGRYICNLLYYESLYAGFKSLFIHVPPFSAIPKHEQIDLIVRILDVLK